MNTPLIYCVEDDQSIRDLMVYTLNSTGFTGIGFSDGEAFWKGMKEKIPQLVILDIMLPGEDGISILKKLRKSVSTENIPIMIATAKGSECDKVTGLDSGADDYLVKPFGMMEMVSRIKAVLRRSNIQDDKTILTLGDITLDKNRHQIMIKDKNISLTLKEYDLLLLFMENPGLVFTREQLLQKVWQSEFAIETRTVDVHIGTLRTKLGNNGKLIKTIIGVGYCMEEKDEQADL